MKAFIAGAALAAFAVTDRIHIRKTHLLPFHAALWPDSGVHEDDDTISSDNKSLWLADDFGPSGS